jgi:hypothetical protein
VAKSPSKLYRPGSEAAADREFQLRIYKASVFGNLVSQAFRWAGFLGLAYCLVLIVQALAGRYTFADIGLNLLGNITFSKGAAWVFGGGGIGMAWRERRLRHKVNETLGARVSELEQQIDSRRTSSKLTKRGQTNPRDSL